MDRAPDGGDQLDERTIPADTQGPSVASALPSEHPVVGNPRWRLFFVLAAAVVAADQLSKAWLVARLSPGRSLSLVGDLVRLVHGRNTGALFGLFPDQALLFAAVSIGVVAVIVWYHARSGRNLATSIALGLLLGGAIGNLLDRVRLGYVVDFVDVGIGGWRFYTFNVGDAAISTAIALLVLLALWPDLGRRMDG